ncbi:hypothetical protein RJ45_09985 [Photobacterium gaetbulicola]|uniref:Uncharacterized protein n=1 Tax=Photobacterium gaetbulicola TaxID=1295392 RepID=A0A0B9G4S6_9GAMM|nr:hypothetical protein [Photobacterium gaetbulicola]KHT63683.1 hypothetical protein RJ45_09985 [Photobacterium gaetbulicola]
MLIGKVEADIQELYREFLGGDLMLSESDDKIDISKPLKTIKKYKIVYYDTDPEKVEEFKKRHEYIISKDGKKTKGSCWLAIEGYSCINDILERISSHSTEPIDLILVDFFGTKPTTKDIHYELFSGYNKDKSENKSNSNENVNINDIINEFQEHKDYVNIQLSKKSVPEGKYAIKTIHKYISSLGYYDIPIAIHSMLARRLISSKEASELQSMGVLWVWKPKEESKDEPQKEPEKLNAIANAEFDSIHSAITASELKKDKYKDILSDLNRSIIFQVLSFVSLFIAVITLIYGVYLGYNDKNFKLIDKAPELITIISGLLVLLYHVYDYYTFKRKLKKAFL